MKQERGTGGGFPDRGEVADRRNTGEWEYQIRSLTHPDVKSRWIKAAGESAYSIGEKVYYFMMDDGRGLVLGRM